MAFTEVNLKDLTINPFEQIGNAWGLVTAGDEQGFNTMTVSWGSLGVIWGVDAVTVYIRPQRYTKQFIDDADTFTLSFFPPERKAALGVLGSKSGRDSDKVAEVGFTPVHLDGTTTFAEANLVFVCRKLYADDIEPGHLIDPSIDDTCYPNRDYHTLYIGKIEHVYQGA